MVTGQSPDLAASHGWRENSVSSSEGSSTSAAAQSLCGAGLSSLDMGSAQLLWPPLKYIPGGTETIWPDSCLLRCFVLWDPLVGRFTWALTQHPGLLVASTGSERGSYCGLPSELEEHRVRGDCGGCGVPMRETSLTLRGEHGDQDHAVELYGGDCMCHEDTWDFPPRFHFPEYWLPKGDPLDSNSVVFVQIF